MQDRVDAVLARIADACRRSGREPDAVQLVAVAKTFGPESVRAVADCGIRVIGENRVQEAVPKAEQCPPGLSWHMVGRLQSNKVRPAVALFDMVQSVDSCKLLSAIDSAAGAAGTRPGVLLQVNVSGEASKSGFRPDDVMEALTLATELRNVDVMGLMTIPPFTVDPEDARPHFARLRAWRDEWRHASGFPLEELSMGMSGDLEVGVEEGATLVRVGTALFGRRRGGAWRPTEGSSG
jgi:pyridoxal phosphate enzyme (YggS family)